MIAYVNSGLAMVLAQSPEIEIAALSPPQFFTALLSGLVLAFGFQLLLTNLSLAAGISYVGWGSSSHESSGGVGLGKISAALGIWTLITVSLALFFACLLAVKMSLYSSALLGAITGLVIWGTYFTLLFWVSSTTVGSLIGSVVKTATASFNALVDTATSAFGARSASNQVYETAEAVAAAVRKELAQSLGGDDLLEALKDYTATLRSPELDTQTLEVEFERLIQTSNVAHLANQDVLSQIDREAFEKLVVRRTDLSRQEARRVANRLYRTWQKALGQASGREPLVELVDYVRTARPGEAMAEQLGERLDQLLAEYRKQRQSQSSSLLSQGFNALTGMVMGRTDLSDLDVEKITNQIAQAKSQILAQGSSLARKLDSGKARYSVVKADVENYLLNTYPWQMQPERLKVEFRELLYDAEADAGALRQELAPLNRLYFQSLLESRGLMTLKEIDQTASLLESVRLEVLWEVTDIERFEKAKALKGKVQTFLRHTPKEELMSNMGNQAFISLLEDPDASYEDLQNRFSELGWESFALVLRTRADLIEPEVQQLATQFERLMHQVLADTQGLQQAAKTRIDNQWQKLQDYLRNTGKAELNPEGIKADISLLMQEPDAGIHRLRQRLAQFDRDTLIQLLSQRQDLSEAEAQRILRDVEDNWHDIVQSPAALSAQANAKYKEATRALEDYLRRTGKPELNPDGIKRDLQTLLDDPKAGMQAMGERLAQVDRDTLVQLLSQRNDLSEAEVNQIIDDMLEAIRNVLKTPKRLALRAQQQALSFEQGLEDYLRNTQKAELHPAGIKRDLQLLLNDPRLGRERLAERLAAIDRDTVVALLAQRPDMTREEAEAAVDQVLAVRDQILRQVHRIQEQAQALINRLLERIRAYLDSLDRPELSYEGIRRDLRKLFEDPQAGFEALKYRFSQFDRDTLAAILSSHDAISEQDVHQVIDQIESTRDSVLQRAERLEQEVDSRIQALKLQAEKQVEDTRQAAEIAAWWIFGTATISAAAAAIAGSLAVIG